MKRLLLIATILACFSFKTNAQKFNYYLDNSLVILDGNGFAIPFPFVGGLNAPQFNECDLNFDGAMDLVIFDRSGNTLLTYINDNKPGVSSYYYAPQYQDAFPKLHSWVVMVDYNHDGKMDIFTEPDASEHVIGVAVYKNTSSNGKISFEKNTDYLLYYEYDRFGDSSYNQYNYVYSQTNDYPAIVDIDGDGDLDFLTSDISGSFFMLYQNKQKDWGLPDDSLMFAKVDDCWGSFMEGSLDNTISLGVNCKNAGLPRYYKKSGKHSGTTLTLFDKDDDKDMDLLIGDVSTQNIIMIENGKSDFNYPYDTMISVTKDYPTSGISMNVNLFPATFYLDVNNDGKKDVIVAPNNGSAQSRNQIQYFKNIGTTSQPVFDFQTDNFIQQHMLDIGSGCAPFMWDADGDGKLDLLVANRGKNETENGGKEMIAFFKNVSPNADSFVFKYMDSNYMDFYQYGIHDMKPAMGDLNGDGKLDMVIGDYNGKIHYFENTTTNPNNPTFKLIDNNFKSIEGRSSAAPQIIDLDNDGLNDLVIGNFYGYLRFFKNIGTKTVPNFNSKPTIDTLGKLRVSSFSLKAIYDSLYVDVIGYDTIADKTGYATPHFADLDNNGKLDLIVGSVGGKLYTYSNIENNLNGKFTEIRNIRYSNYYDDFRDTRFGGRIAPCTYYDNTTLKRNIIIGNFNGGLNYLRSDTGIVDTTSPGNVKRRVENQSKIYPNPAIDQIKIEILKPQDGMTEIWVYDMQGRLCQKEIFPYTKYTHSMSVADLADGLYTVQIFTTSQLVLQDKFIVQKK